MGFSPVEASEHITKKYKRYLKTIFSIDNDIYNKQFHDLLSDQKSLAAGPFLDVSDSFEKGKSISELIEEGILAEGFKKINIPIERPLYRHQEEAIRKVSQNNNLIVSTGTGSGKTESFMIPLLNHIIREHEGGTLDSGVRALLIYPMNALANDQIERLRDLLADYPEITYGSYTGQTKQKYGDALAEYKQLNEGKEPLSNELISREQIKNTPPHILVTNYAMLEYLMVRPGDNVFFSEENANKWKFIVLDEAHVYNGSSGIEVAMLLRRLKAKLKNDNINYILTSATLGDEKSDGEVADFGKNLCNSYFDKKNIVRAFRKEPEIKKNCETLPISFYRDLAELYHNDDEEEIKKYLSENFGFSSINNIEETLFDIIINDRNYAEIKNLVSETRTLYDIAAKKGWRPEDLASFVTVASKAEKNGERLFDARYHMFLRATESVFITLNPSNKLFLTRKKKHFEPDGTDYHVFEIATCSVCHAIYLIGTIKNDHLEQSTFNNEEDLCSVFLLRNEISDTDEDHSMENENIEAEEYEICARCGFIRKAGRSREQCCEHGNDYIIKVQKVQTKNGKKTLTKCLACENTNSSGILRMFFSGQEAVTSVIGTALYEELPSYKTVTEVVEDEDEFGFGGEQTTVKHKISEAKQFMAFSDSRQAAAFFASYFDQTYRNILYKRLIVETLNLYSAGEKIPVNQFIDDLASNFEKYGVLKNSLEQSKKEAWKAFLQEIVDNNGTTSLYNMGLIGFTFDPDSVSQNVKLNLSKEDVCNLCNVFALGMMSDAAIHYNCNMNEADRQFFAHNGIENSYTLSDPDVIKHRKAFIPRFIDKSNKRADYLGKVLKKAGKPMEQEQINKALESIWKGLFLKNGYIKPFEGSYKLDCDNLYVIKPEKWYICPKCKKITPFYSKGVCPSYKCDGELIPIDLEKVLSDNHYYELYQNLDIRGLKVVEHTAQLNKETAYEYQKQFKRKEIDVLSCSTTFEMGVDVGSLEMVFMRNMPPSPANYAQRAGRAGRSKKSAAFALTFCNKSNHDFSFFTNPVKMIKGKIDPPKFAVDNEKIAIRHVYASALSFFWNKYPDYFSNASTMMEGEENSVNGIEKFKIYLESKPDDLREFLKDFLPSNLSIKFGVDDFSWLNMLFGTEENPGLFKKAELEYNYEVGILKEAKEEIIRNDGFVDKITQRIRVYQKEDILSFLSRKNIMPKYGFPVDTVEMSVVGKNASGRIGLQLQRDLSIAISEYAPGSQVVANGSLLTSRYIKKVPRMSWKMYDYIMCDCKTLNIEPHVDDVDLSGLSVCHRCGKELEPFKKRVFLVPEFGFEADGDKIEKPGLKKPERTYRGETAYVGYRADINTERFCIDNATVEIAMSRGDEMAVINESNFFVCETCGFTDLDEGTFTKTKKMKHNNPSGYPCKNNGNNILKRFSPGYRFETDVLQLRFINPDIEDWDTAISILYGVLKGACSYLNIEENDISGCVQYFFNDVTRRANFALILYDKTPGGAGHVCRLGNERTLKNVLCHTLSMMESCTCGGEAGDSSCYSCLRNYYNQKYHDILSRGKVIEFIRSFISSESN